MNEVIVGSFTKLMEMNSHDGTESFSLNRKFLSACSKLMHSTTRSILQQAYRGKYSAALHTAVSENAAVVFSCICW